MHINDLSWNNWSDYASMRIDQLCQLLRNGEEGYMAWQTFRGGRTNNEIATALSVTETKIAELDAAMGALHALYSLANNQAVGQSDYFYAMRKFSVR